MGSSKKILLSDVVLKTPPAPAHPAKVEREQPKLHGSSVGRGVSLEDVKKYADQIIKTVEDAHKKAATSKLRFSELRRKTAKETE